MVALKVLQNILKCSSTASAIPVTFLLDSGVLANQQLNERTQQRLASLADIVNKLEKPQLALSTC